MKGKILAVDDSLFIREMLRGLLTAGGYEVVTGVNGEEAVSLVESERPDLVLLDIEMPKLDGISAAKLLRANPANKFINIVFLTANDSLKLKKTGFEIGADDYIVKPFEGEELLARVDRKMVHRMDNQQETDKARVDTLSQLMVTLAHNINNALGALKGREEVTDFSDPAQVIMFRKIFLKQTDRIHAVVECIKDMAADGTVKSTQYTEKQFMLDIAKNLEERLSQQHSGKS